MVKSWPCICPVIPVHSRTYAYVNIRLTGTINCISRIFQLLHRVIGIINIDRNFIVKILGLVAPKLLVEESYPITASHLIVTGVYKRRPDIQAY